MMRKKELGDSVSPDDRCAVVSEHAAGDRTAYNHTAYDHTAKKEHRAMSGREQKPLRWSPQRGMIPQRGEIWFAEFGHHPGTSVQGGCRPALVISNDIANRYSTTVTVVPMTTRMKKEYMPTHVVIRISDVNTVAGQHFRCSMLLAEQVTTIGKDALVSCMGRIKEAKLKETESALLAQMNITNADAGLCERTLSGEKNFGETNFSETNFSKKNFDKNNLKREEMAFGVSEFRRNPRRD